MLPLVVLGRRLLVEEGILGQLLLKVHGVDGRLGGRGGAGRTATDKTCGSDVLWGNAELTAQLTDFRITYSTRNLP